MNQQELMNYKKGKSAEQIKVIDYFTKQGCLAFGVMKDDQYRSLVHRRRDAMKMRERALAKVGVDEDQLREIPPVCLQGYKFMPSAFAKKRTAAGSYVSSAYQVAWLFFSDRQIYLYSMLFNMDEDRKREETQEFFYKDVTSLSTVTKTYSSDNKEKEDSIRSFGGTKIQFESTEFQITVPGEKLLVAINELDTPEHEAVIQAMKHKLREKKS